MPAMGKGGPPTRVAPVTSNLLTVPKTGEAKGGARAYGMLDGVMAVRTNVLADPMGAQHRITATLYAQNAAEAGAVGRNVRLMPSAVGYRDFRSGRGA